MQLRRRDRLRPLATRPATTSPATSRKQQQQQVLGALVLGGLVAAAGDAYGSPASDDAIRQAMDVGATLGARAYSQSYELEADTLGAYIAARAGYDPERGADDLRAARRSPTPAARRSSPRHPASAQRQATVARVAADIRAPAGRRPRPDPAAVAALRNSPRRAFWGLRLPAPLPRYPVTAPDGARTGSQRRGKTGQHDAGRVKAKTLSVARCPPLFDMYYLMKGYAGGLVHFDGRTFAYRPTRG